MRGVHGHLRWKGMPRALCGHVAGWLVMNHAWHTNDMSKWQCCSTITNGRGNHKVSFRHQPVGVSIVSILKYRTWMRALGKEGRASARCASGEVLWMYQAREGPLSLRHHESPGEMRRLRCAPFSKTAPPAPAPRGRVRLLRMRASAPRVWMPAFAGMTRQVGEWRGWSDRLTTNHPERCFDCAQHDNACTPREILRLRSV